MTPSSAKAKGRNLQNWVRDTLLAYNTELTNEDIRSTSMGVTGEDITLSPAARRLIPFQFECKSKNRIAVYTFYDQCKQHGGHEPIVIVKQNRAAPLAVLSAETLFKLIKEIYGTKASN